VLEWLTLTRIKHLVLGWLILSIIKLVSVGWLALSMEHLAIVRLTLMTVKHLTVSRLALTSMNQLVLSWLTLKTKYLLLWCLTILWSIKHLKRPTHVLGFSIKLYCIVVTDMFRPLMRPSSGWWERENKYKYICRNYSTV